MLSLFGCKIILFINLVYRFFKPIYLFLNQFTNIRKNPQKKRIIILLIIAQKVKKLLIQNFQNHHLIMKMNMKMKKMIMK